MVNIMMGDPTMQFGGFQGMPSGPGPGPLPGAPTGMPFQGMSIGGSPVASGMPQAPPFPAQPPMAQFPQQPGLPPAQLNNPAAMTGMVAPTIGQLPMPTSDPAALAGLGDFRTQGANSLIPPTGGSFPTVGSANSGVVGSGFQPSAQAIAQPMNFTPNQVQQGTTGVGQAPQSATSAIPTGLLGAEAALQQGALGGINAINQGSAGARQDLLIGSGAALNELGGAVDVIGQGVSRGTEALTGAQPQALDFLGNATNQATSGLTGFQQSGQAANQLQAALSGADGAEAQAQAFQNFQDSPGQDFLQERARKSLLRSANAIGNLGGGRTGTALVEQAVGFGRQAINDRFNQLGQLSGQGLQAAGQIGQLRGNEGQVGANVISQTANNIANLTQSGAFAQADLGGKAAMIEQQTGTSLAQLESQTGLNIAQVMQDLGSQSSQVRNQAGRDMAEAISQTSQGLAGLQAQQGAGISDATGNAIANIGDLILKQGVSGADSARQLASFLGNLATGQGSTAANIASNVGLIEANGILGTNSAVQGAIGGLTQLLGKKAEG